jgi:hypothetical protein
MRRFLVPTLVPLLLLLAGCAGNVSAGAPKASPSPGRGFRNGASGQLVKITGTTLILSGASGDTTVTFDSTTRITRTSTASVADIVPGVCLFAVGLKDASGAVTANTVRLTPAANGSCTPQANLVPGGGGLPGFGTPRPDRPTPPANFGIVAGVVTAVAGTAVTVKGQSGTTATVTVPTTVLVSKTADASAADLQIGECLAAAGNRDAAGTIQARSLTIRPPTASGTCSGFGRGGGAGGFFFGGGTRN